MSYEFDPENRPPGFETAELADDMVRGRWKGSCEGEAPGVIGYGFVFEEDSNVQFVDCRNDLQPNQVDVQFTDQLDLELPGQIRAATTQQLHTMRREFCFDERRAGGDPWIGPSHEWKRRREMVEQELTRRGILFGAL